MKYTVRFEIDIDASTPRRAAIRARDVMLDPDALIIVDVHEPEYCIEADEYFPCENNGWYARFDGQGIELETFFKWQRMKT